MNDIELARRLPAAIRHMLNAATETYRPIAGTVFEDEAGDLYIDEMVNPDEWAQALMAALALDCGGKPGCPVCLHSLED